MELFPDIAKQEHTVSAPQKIKELYFSFVFNFISCFFFNQNIMITLYDG